MNGWISCDAAVPEMGPYDHVMISVYNSWNGTRFVDLGTYDSGRWFSDYLRAEISNGCIVEAWQELPEPYEEI